MQKPRTGRRLSNGCADDCVDWDIPEKDRKRSVNKAIEVVRKCFMH